MTVATVAVRVSLAVLAAGAGIGFGLRAAIQDPTVPVATEQQVSVPDQSTGSVPDAASSQTAEPTREPAAQETTDLYEPPRPESLPCTTPKPAGSWACVNGLWTMTVPGTPDEQTAVLPSDLTADDINPLTGTPVVTPTETTPLPGAGNTFGNYGVAAVGSPGAPTWTSYGGWLSDGPGVPSTTLVKSTPCTGPRPARGNWYCYSGTWMPTLPGASVVTSYDTQWNTSGPGVPAYIPVTVPVTPVLDPIITSYGCAGVSPGTKYTCLNGSWVVR